MPHLIAIMGPTASGKSELAEMVADHTDAQLLNGDAFQVYRGLDIGTGKSGEKGRYSLIDIANPSEQFGLGAWVGAAAEVLLELWTKGRSAVVVGGSGLYIRSLLEGYDKLSAAPDPNLRQRLAEDEREHGTLAMYRRLQQIDAPAASRVAPSNPRRVLRALEKALDPSPGVRVEIPPFSKLKFATNPPKDTLVHGIENRLDKMLAAGWLEEVAGLKRSGSLDIDSPGLKAIGYRTLWEHLDGRVSMNDAKERILIATRQYAKRQRTWLRSEPNLVLLEKGREFQEVIESIRSQVASDA